ncbi:conserved hypothetical protein [Neospora caninum Liverpool]|uniref:Fe2OG dioxygenase domain-containing protein n=1 Tax=Neospora caninum (strain Liverpool) TaxID=572307 RepID=F0VGV6_NEOCL|nr:conserved hypothetical protein [Neospora caninum Liverpool]CBZ52950.1 conserved hypothetical protein [Neospora caninum Liverpool]CEL66935.1 TPA: hypothetical protein BN1204_027390 [Neospora caninum Liverpool]|eukprot:XP_003882982.1 conserved hypothetical protein [Neospora caninum Liverpool]
MKTSTASRKGGMSRQHGCMQGRTGEGGSGSSVDAYKERETLLRAQSWESIFISQVLRLTAGRHETSSGVDKSLTTAPTPQKESAEQPLLSCEKEGISRKSGEETTDATLGQDGCRRGLPSRNAERVREAGDGKRGQQARGRREELRGETGEEAERTGKVEEAESEGGEGDCCPSALVTKEDREDASDFELIGGLPLPDQTLRFDALELRQLLDRTPQALLPVLSSEKRSFSSPSSPALPTSRSSVSAEPNPVTDSAPRPPLSSAPIHSSLRCSSPSSPGASGLPSSSPSSVSSGSSSSSPCVSSLLSVSDSSAGSPAVALSPSLSSRILTSEEVSLSLGASARLAVYEVCTGALLLPAFLSESEQLYLARECLSVYSRPPHICNICNLLGARETPEAASSSLPSSAEKRGQGNGNLCEDGQSRSSSPKENLERKAGEGESSRDAHEPVACRQFDGDLSRENPSVFVKNQLRWVTLGRHYDWTRRAYEDEGEERPSRAPSSLGRASAAEDTKRRGESRTEHLENQPGACGEDAAASSSCCPSSSLPTLPTCPPTSPSFDRSCLSAPCLGSSESSKWSTNGSAREETDTQSRTESSALPTESPAEAKVETGSEQPGPEAANTKQREGCGVASSGEKGEAREEEREDERGEEREAERQTTTKTTRTDRGLGDEKANVNHAGLPRFPPALEKLCDDILQFAEPFLQGATAAGCKRPKMNAAILNVYRKGDRLRGHKDDAERVEAPLISISLGQPAIFLLGGVSRQVAPKAVVLRSGDVLVLSGPARWAVHGVPKLLYYTSVTSVPARRRRRKPKGAVATPSGMKAQRPETSVQGGRRLHDRKTRETVTSTVRGVLEETGLTHLSALDAEGSLRLLKSEKRRENLHSAAIPHWVNLLESRRHRSGTTFSDAADNSSRGGGVSRSDNEPGRFEKVPWPTLDDVDAWLGELRLNLSCRYDNHPH